MILVERYIFRMCFFAFLAVLSALTLVIWVTQALRDFNLLTTRDHALVSFLKITGLALPSLIMIIAPIALFIAILYTLNKLNSDSELIVMNAAGLSPFQLLRPIIANILLAVFFVAVLSLWLMPLSFRLSRDLLSEMRAQFISEQLKPGVFTALEDGLVFHFREKGADGTLLGLFIQDFRDMNNILTYIADSGQTVSADEENYLELKKGNIERKLVSSPYPDLIQFDRWALNLAQLSGDEADADSPLRPRERSTGELLSVNRQDPYYQKNTGRFRAELNDRLQNPLFAVALGLLAFAALFQARTVRRGRNIAILIVTLIAISLRLAGMGLSAASQRYEWATILGYALLFVLILLSIFYVFLPARMTHFFKFPKIFSRVSA